MKPTLIAVIYSGVLLFYTPSRAEVIKCIASNGSVLYADNNTCEDNSKKSVISVKENVSSIERQNKIGEDKDGDPDIRQDVIQKHKTQSASDNLSPNQQTDPHVEHLNPTIKKFVPRNILKRNKRKLSRLPE